VGPRQIAALAGVMTRAGGSGRSQLDAPGDKR
jgi:hypothetical protein